MNLRYLPIPDCPGYTLDTYRNVVVNGRGRVMRTFLDKWGYPCFRMTCENGKQSILRSSDILEKLRKSDLIMG